VTLRVLMATDWYPPYIGGAERQTELLSKELVQRGHAVTVATTWSDRAPDREDDQGVQVYRLKGWSTYVPFLFRDANWKRPHPPLPDPGIALALRALIRRTRPDVVQATGWIAYSAAVALLGSRTPLVISWREYGYTCAQRSLFRNNQQPCDGPSPLKCLQCGIHIYGWAKGIAMVGSNYAGRPLLAKKVTRSHAISSYVRNVVERDLLHGNIDSPFPKVTLIPDFVVTNPAGRGANDPGDAAVAAYIARLPRQPFILFVGQLQENKGIFKLLEAYQRLAPAPPLVLMGAIGPGSPAQLPANVTLIENVPNAAVMAAWERCLFGVAPSIWAETFCTVITEAMSRGKAMIASALGGPMDLIEPERTGLLVQPGNVAALAAAMQRLIDDPALTERLGAAARERVKRFTPEVVIPRFEAMYYDLVRQYRAGATS